LGCERHAIHIRRHPKKVYSRAAASPVARRLMSDGTTQPSAAEITVIAISAVMAPANTVALGWRMAIRAATMKVSSPISVARI